MTWKDTLNASGLLVPVPDTEKASLWVCILAHDKTSCLCF